MILRLWWQILSVECICVCISLQSFPQKRQCAFQVMPHNDIYSTAGSVNGSVQLCNNTQCCAGYYVVVDGEPMLDALACDLVERSCPDETCKARRRVNGRVIKCTCSTDLCNTNISWAPESEEPQPTSPYSGDQIVKIVLFLVGTLLLLCFIAVAAKQACLLKHKELTVENPLCLDDVGAALLCSCETRKPFEINATNIDLQQIVSHGQFATVWKGKYQGSVVAVKVFPAGWKNKFAAEREVYELPLMKHAGIVHFLGTGMKPDGSSWLIVLQFAEYGTLNSFLHENTNNWTLSLRLSQSLSQGLSYLHSDLHRQDAHKPPVAHRDLSSSNVLVRADGTCALCDFGCSTILRPFSGHCCRQSYSSNAEVQAQFGTLRYMSPEILEGSINLQNTFSLIQGDIYALALLLWELWMRCSDLFEGGLVPQRLLPYESELGANITMESLILHVCHMDQRPSIPAHWQRIPQVSAVLEILTDCWDCDPDARLTAQCVADRFDSF